jgi:hypothetical protein
MKSLLGLTGLCALLCGCMGVQQEEYYWAHFGTYPTNYHDLVSTWVDKNFESPRTVYISAPVRARVPKKLLNTDEKVYAWCSGVSFEAVGPLDRYTPRQQYHLYLREGEILTTTLKKSEESSTEGIAQAQPAP